jgi:AraC-like DNA-binding protein
MDGVGWLENVREVRHPLSATRPLWVRHVHLDSGGVLPEPAMLTPEWHPHCELSYIFQGRLMQFVGTEKIEKRRGDLMLLGGGTPHYAMHLAYPLRYVTVYFTPTLLFELGPEGDGARAMARFVGAQRIEERVVHLPSPLSQSIAERLEQMVVEFAAHALGSELLLRALLLETLVELLRWEQTLGRIPPSRALQLKWPAMERALRFIHGHYAKQLYVAQIAREAGATIAHLQTMFKHTLGMSCIQYLRSYRISHAAALLQTPEARVTEVALAVGFESLGHFNSSFHSFLGLSPMQYRRAWTRNPR